MAFLENGYRYQKTDQTIGSGMKKYPEVITHKPYFLQN